MVGKAREEMREERALKGWKGEQLVGNYSTMLIILLSKRSKEKET